MRLKLSHAIGLLFLLLPAAVSADCIEYENYIHWVGQKLSVGLGYYEKDIVISGTLAYVVAGDRRALQIVDISNPSTPQLVGSIDAVPYPLIATGLTVQGSIAYVTAQSGLVIVNVANPAAPAILKTVYTPSVAEDVVVSGSYAYVADYSSGLQVINISNPATAAIVGAVDTPGNAFGVSLNGSILYLADEYLGLQVINVTNPLAPAIIGTRDTPGNAQDLRSIGSMVYVADAQNGIEVINASTPTAPVIVGNINTPGYAWDLVISGGRAYVADGDSGLQIVDISNPFSPVIVGHKDSPGTNVARAVAVSGSFAFVVANGAGPGENNFGLQVIDVSHLASPSVIGNVVLPLRYTFSIEASGSWVYIAGDSLAAVVDVSDPSAPVVAATATFPGVPSDIALSGTKAYVGYVQYSAPPGSRYGGLSVVDVSNPASPQVQGHVDVNIESGIVVAASGTLAFLGLKDRFFTVDVSDPNHPSILGALPGVGFTIRGIAVSGSEAYVAANDFSNNGFLYKINISNPAAPSIIGSLLFPGLGATDVILSGGLAYVPVVSTSSSTVPGFRVAAVSGPGAPTLVGGLNLGGTTDKLAISGSVLYAACEEGGLEVVDVSNPSQPKLLGGADVYTYAKSVAVSGPWVYVASLLNPSGFAVLSQECPAGVGVSEDREEIGVTLGQAFPNPNFAGSTTIPFSMPARGQATLRILDLSGREVRVLVDDVLEAGEQSVAWDGRNAKGQLVPAGIYFYELQGHGFDTSRKLVRIR